jgi:hypothetical protein
LKFSVLSCSLAVLAMELHLMTVTHAEILDHTEVPAPVGVLTASSSGVAAITWPEPPRRAPDRG